MKSPSQGHRLASLGGEGLPKCTASTSNPVPGHATILGVQRDTQILPIPRIKSKASHMGH